MKKSELKQLIREVKEELNETYFKEANNVDIMNIIHSKFIDPVYKLRENTAEKIKKYLESKYKGKFVNVNPTFYKEVNNAKVLGFTVSFYVDEILPRNINYRIVMKTDQGEFEMLDKTWTDNFEIVK